MIREGCLKQLLLCCSVWFSGSSTAPLLMGVQTTRCHGYLESSQLVLTSGLLSPPKINLLASLPWGELGTTKLPCILGTENGCMHGEELWGRTQKGCRQF